MEKLDGLSSIDWFPPACRTLAIHQSPVSRPFDCEVNILNCLKLVENGDYVGIESQLREWESMHLLDARLPAVIECINDYERKFKVLQMAIPKLQNSYIEMIQNERSNGEASHSTSGRIRIVWRDFSKMRRELASAYAPNLGQTIINEIKDLIESNRGFSEYELLQEMIEYIEDDRQKLEVVESFLLPKLRKVEFLGKMRVSRNLSKSSSNFTKRDLESYEVFFKMRLYLEKKLGKHSFLEQEIESALSVQDFENVKRIVDWIDDPNQKLLIVRRLVTAFLELHRRRNVGFIPPFINPEAEKIVSLFKVFFRMRIDLERELEIESSLQQDIDNRMILHDYEGVAVMIQLVEEKDTKIALLANHEDRFRDFYRTISEKMPWFHSQEDKIIKEMCENLYLK